MHKLRWAAAASIALLLAGCGSGNGENGSPAEDPATEDPEELTEAPADEDTGVTDPSGETDDSPGEAGTDESDKPDESESGTEAEESDGDPAEEVPSETPAEFTAADLFPPQGAELHFKGEGNEFAELDITIRLSDGKHVVLDENNGGVIMRKAYRISEERIEQLMGMPLEGDEPVPTAGELDKMDPMNTFMVFPAEVGTEFDGWTVIGNDETVETPYGNFEHAVMIEEKTADFTNRVWLVPGFGEVKRESAMEEEGQEPFVVTSALESATGISQ